jgi:hypothetical protein
MKLWRLVRLVRHPVAAIIIAVLVFPVVMKLTANAVYVAELFAAADSPANISDLRLKRSFDRATAEREIRLALAGGDVDLAQSFVALGNERHLSIKPALVDKVNVASAAQGSVGNKVSDFIRGFWTGQADDGAAVVGDTVSDVLFFGDLRDSVRETVHYLKGQRYDPWILGMSAAGVAATAATYFAGTGLPERIGLSLAKITRRTDRLNPALAIRMSKAAEDGRLTQLAENVARLDERAGVQTTLNSLALAKGPDDMARIGQLAAAKGVKTRAILKLFGRGAFVVTVTAWAVAKWVVFASFGAVSLLIWTATAVLAFLGWCKTLAGSVARFLTPPRPRGSSA